MILSSSFPHRSIKKERAIEIIKGIIENNLKQSGDRLRVNMYCYTVGKEEICIGLAKAFKTKILLDPERHRYIKRANYYTNFFTMKEEESFIRLTSGVNRKDKEVKDHLIHINLTGWINCSDFMSLTPGEYMVAYSSHSNYPELDKFVSVVKPGVLSNIVIEKDSKLCLTKLKSFSSYFFYLKNFKQRGLEELSKLTRKDVL